MYVKVLTHHGHLLIHSVSEDDDETEMQQLARVTSAYNSAYARPPSPRGVPAAAGPSASLLPEHVLRFRPFSLPRIPGAFPTENTRGKRTEQEEEVFDLDNADEYAAWAKTFGDAPSGRYSCRVCETARQRSE